MNVTLSIDEQLVAEARKVAAARGTSLNQMIRDELERLTAAPTGEEIMRDLEEQWSRSEGRSGGWTWNRDDLYDRPILR